MFANDSNMSVDEIVVTNFIKFGKYCKTSYISGTQKANIIFYLPSGSKKFDKSYELVYWPLKDVEKYNLKPDDFFEFHSVVYGKYYPSDKGFVSLRSEVKIYKID